uniref:ATP-dependent DNA helicase n=1 Tax=Nicotiana sylvestris TaxID=4096 RepID=A0A1U7Y5V1_NICSY|nr:PREDICTED: uncharacterized protein LOC104241378 [Nicotiana sylvestris]
MAKKELIEALDLLLRDLIKTTMLFGGKVVVFSGDFRQTLPVVRGGQREDFVQRFNIIAITPETEEWTCKVQVVDKGRPRDNREKTKKYQLMVLQDEEKNQVECIMFNAEIMHFEDLFHHFHTYLVSVAQFKESNYTYGNPLNKFTRTIDKCTIIEPIEIVNPPEDPLPPPTRLNLTPFCNFEYQPYGSEFSN